VFYIFIFEEWLVLYLFFIFNLKKKKKSTRVILTFEEVDNGKRCPLSCVFGGKWSRVGKKGKKALV